ncbi:MAG: cytochrome c [Nitrospirae bacterium]|nr:cytochrome c [Nitrospirota bacterium]
MRNTRVGLTLLAPIFLLSVGWSCAAQTAAPPDDTPLARGKAVYEQHCLACHGAQGRGDGYPFLKPPPADLSAAVTRSKTDADLLITIRHGHPDTAMGAWRVVLSEKASRDVLAYVRTLQK